MKKLFLILCVLGVLFGNDATKMYWQAIDAQNKGDYQKAQQLFASACEQGSNQSCLDLGDMFKKGEGVVKNLSKAEEYYMKACSKKDDNGCVRLNLLAWEYLKKSKTEVDFLSKESQAKALQIFVNTCDRNSKSCDSLTALGYRYYFGRYEVSRDMFKAFEIFQIGCKKGENSSCSMLGRMYVDGDGVRQNYYKGIQLLKETCKMENDLDCNMLGKLYENGRGVKRDKKQAKEYYGKACDLKNEEGCKDYARLNEAGY